MMHNKDEALALILSHFHASNQHITLPLAHINGHILAQTYHATADFPKHDVSAMDGYAVCYDNLTDKLDIIGESAAGHHFDNVVQHGQAVRIFTGAPLPKGVDTVIIQENTTKNDNQITINAMPKYRGQHVRKQASDIKKGNILVNQGIKCHARYQALLATHGIAQVNIAKPPKIAIMACGDELIEYQQQPQDYKIYESNRLLIKQILKQFHCDIIDLGIAKDNEADIVNRLKNGFAENCDLIITIGGASVGDHDYLKSSLEKIKWQQILSKVAIKPGKPIFFGNYHENNDNFILGLAGNPVSAYVCTLLFIIPIIEKLINAKQSMIKESWLPLASPLEKNGNREEYMRSYYCFHDDNILSVKAMDSQDSAMLNIMAQSECLIKRPIDDSAKNIGDKVCVIDIERF